MEKQWNGSYFSHKQQIYRQHYGIGMLKIQNGLQNGLPKYDLKQKCSKVQFKTTVSQSI